MPKNTSTLALKLRGPGPVLICRKCLKRFDEGGKLKRRLKAELKQGAERKKDRRRLVFANCFGICPKGAVVAASPATMAKGELLLIRDCSRESVEKAAASLV